MLYQNDLFFVRAAGSDRFLDALLRREVVQGTPSDDVVLLTGGARAFFREHVVTIHGDMSVQVAIFLIEDADVPLFTSDIDALLSWFELAARTTELLVAYMPSGPDSRSPKVSLDQFLGPLLDEGRVTAAHPLMWFNESIAAGRPCSGESSAYRTFRSPGIGCLFALVDVAADGSFEILEPSADHAYLLSAWID